MVDQRFTFFVSHVRVEVECVHADALAAVRVVWSGCERALQPTREHARFAVEHADDGFAVRGPHGVRHTREPLDVLPLLEAAIYAAMQDWHRELLALHAGCVSDGETAWVLLGRSGAGKSSLARAAVRRGLQYGSDEITLCDGQRLWGVPRAIQFAPLLDGDPPPHWLGEVDRERYRLRVTEQQRGCMPLWPPPREQIATAPFPLARVRVLAIERADKTELVPLHPLELLAALHEAAYRPPAFDLGALVRGGPGGLLRWSRPDQAIDALLSAPA